jgi:phosphoglycerol transferase MdoB-like AlkP superfamily enzyme
MPRYLFPFLKTVATVLLLILGYSIFRLSFYGCNKEIFGEIEFGTFLNLMVGGLRFDLSAIVSVNCIFILWSLLPYGRLQGRVRRRFLRPLFVITNTFAALFEIADWAYFPFNHKRSTSDVLDMVGRKGDFLNLLPGFAAQYWYLFVVALVVSFMFYVGYNIIERLFNRLTIKEGTSASNAILGWTMTLVGIAMAIIGQRGGLQLIPINIRNAVETTSSKYCPIVLNTPFSIINSIGNKHLSQPEYMPLTEAIEITQPIKRYSDGKFNKKNVVIIILESYSRSFTGLGSETSYTPFLDSLANEGMAFTNAYANALRSAEGLPAILAGIPSLMEEPIATSVYSTNKITSIPNLLSKEGYHTSFYHGATNGSMSFDVFTRSAGIDHYYGRNEYNNEKDYDGNWGIFDEPFLLYSLKGLNNTPQPFFSTIFTLSSHTPYTLPAAYKDKFPAGSMPIIPCIGYTDYSLRKFFENAAQQAWFHNTLFVITADHAAPVDIKSYYTTGLGRYEIPLIFYAPGDTSLKGRSELLCQQIDILPSVMHYLGYARPFFSLGNSVFDSNQPRFVINSLSGSFNWIEENHRFVIAGETLEAAYLFPQDKLGNNNLLQTNGNIKEWNKGMRNWQAFFQTYCYAMAQNKMSTATFEQR